MQEFQCALRVVWVLTHLREIPFNQEYFLNFSHVQGTGLGGHSCRREDLEMGKL